MYVARLHVAAPFRPRGPGHGTARSSTRAGQQYHRNEQLRAAAPTARPRAHHVLHLSTPCPGSGVCHRDGQAARRKAQHQPPQLRQRRQARDRCARHTACVRRPLLRCCNDISTGTCWVERPSGNCCCWSSCSTRSSAAGTVEPARYGQPALQQLPWPCIALLKQLWSLRAAGIRLGGATLRQLQHLSSLRLAHYSKTCSSSHLPVREIAAAVTQLRIASPGVGLPPSLLGREQLRQLAQRGGPR